MRTALGILTFAIAVSFLGSTARADALAKLKPDKLEAVHKAVLALRADWRKLDRPGPYKEYRANIHVHSALSHDSRGTLKEIVAAARATGTRVLMFTEHPADHYDFYKDGHRGVKHGVLLIPGAETQGFLAFPTHSLRGLTAGPPQEFCDLVRRRDGLVFLSHLEERMDWNIHGLTGVEIYNTHADFKDEKHLLAALRNPLWIFKSVGLFRKYPQEAFSALQDYPADYLRRWDQLCEKAPHTGVAANDSHQNVGLLIRLLDKDQVRLEDALGKKLFQLDAGLLPALGPLRKGKKPGDVLFRLCLDPYENSLRHVGTHLFLRELSDKAVWEALEAGRAYVAFDWLADASGFDFAARSGSHRFEMGSRLRLDEGLMLHGRAPLPGHWKLVRNGKTVAESTGRQFNFSVAKPGNYRVEVWLKIAGEDMIWILSNPLYIRPGG
ncbi:MAG TPA: PHP domain-containing protein [Gemmataceae bacterium]|nr:PHP domain-containing protein [Gemmataceae bacterium]